MKIVEEHKIDIPTWAICAIEYRDYSGLTDKDEATLRKWMESLKKDGLEWDITFSCNCLDNEFNPHPEFGLPCATCEATLYYIAKGENA